MCNDIGYTQIGLPLNLRDTADAVTRIYLSSMVHALLGVVLESGLCNRIKAAQIVGQYAAFRCEKGHKEIEKPTLKSDDDFAADTFA